jgi:hypothetical protein
MNSCEQDTCAVIILNPAATLIRAGGQVNHSLSGRSNLEVFEIADHGVTLRFSERTPRDRAAPIEEYRVSYADDDGTLSVLVPAGYRQDHPGELFARMAELSGAGWENDLTFESAEHQLALKATHNRKSHAVVRFELRPRGFGIGGGWERLSGTISIELGQLPGVASEAKAFFGQRG